MYSNMKKTFWRDSPVPVRYRFSTTLNLHHEGELCGFGVIQSCIYSLIYFKRDKCMHVTNAAVLFLFIYYFLDLFLPVKLLPLQNCEYTHIFVYYMFFYTPTQIISLTLQGETQLYLKAQMHLEMNFHLYLVLLVYLLQLPEIVVVATKRCGSIFI